MFYYVLSNGDAPLRIMFDLELAKCENSLYIDVFDCEGNKLYSLKMSDVNGEYIGVL